MRIAIKVKPNSKKNSVEKTCTNELTLRIKAPAKEGKANQAVVETLSAHFGIAKSRIKIAKGLASKNKIVYIDE